MFHFFPLVLKSFQRFLISQPFPKSKLYPFHPNYSYPPVVNDMFVLFREVPKELMQNVTGGEVHLNMEDHRHEDFLPQKSKVKAFAGKGQMLGRWDRTF